MPTAPDLVREVLRLHFRGLTPPQIASDLKCSVYTVLGIMGPRRLRSKWRPDEKASRTPWGDHRVISTVGSQTVDPDWDQP